MNFEGNASYLYVANVARGTDTLAGMAAGSMAIVNEAGTVLTGATTTGKARVAQKLASGQIIYSAYFDMATRKNTAGKSYVAPVQQVSYLGYNGTSGSIPVAAATDYVLNIEWMNTAGIYNNKPLLLSGAYATTAASQQELVTGLLNSLDGAMNRQPYGFVKIERVSDGTFADWTGVATSMTVVNGTKGVVYTNGSGVAAAGEALSDGDLVFIAGSTYVVDGAGTTAGFTIDTEYKGASAEVTGGTTYATQCGLATSVTNWGLKFTGVESTNFVPMSDTWKVTKFDLVSGDFARSDFTFLTAGSEGSGYYKKVANMEAYSQFSDKSPYISAYPRNNEREETLSTKGYDFITFDVNDPVNTSVANGLTTSKRIRIQMALDQALAGDDVDTVFGVTV